MGIFREWSSMPVRLSIDPTVNFERHADRTHYAEVEAKHTAEVERLNGVADACHERAESIKANYIELRAERDSAREALKAAEQEIKIIRADFARHEHNFNNAHILKKERDEARAELAKLKQTDATRAYEAAYNEAVGKFAATEKQYAEVNGEYKQPSFTNWAAKVEGSKPLFAEAVNFTLQRPIGRNEHDRRISRLEAKVANLELGGSR